MKRLAWATDIHLDRLDERDYLEYKEYLQELNPDCLIVSGDIAEGEKVSQSLKDFDELLDFPIYFVLGNHDFYWNSFEQVEREVGEVVKNSKNLIWLTQKGVIELNSSTCLIGVEGWGDGRNGTFDISKGYTRDLLSIKDYNDLNREQILKLMNDKGGYYAELLRPKLIEAANNYQNILFLTHVPPFVEACFDRSLRIIDEFRQPFYTCKAIGDMLLEVMSEKPNCKMTVFCGHTHENADVKILDNLQIRVKESGYGTWWNSTIIKV
jgi:predicted MPP superfamily phosphohydrolase